MELFARMMCLGWMVAATLIIIVVGEIQTFTVILGIGFLALWQIAALRRDIL